MKLSVEKLIADHFIQGDTKKSSQYLRSTASRGHLADLHREQKKQTRANKTFLSVLCLDVIL